MICIGIRGDLTYSELSWQGGQSSSLPYGKISRPPITIHATYATLVARQWQFWQAENRRVVAYGLELGVEGSRSWNSQTLAFRQIIRIRSENQETGRQFYVPYHQGRHRWFSRRCKFLSICFTARFIRLQTTVTYCLLISFRK